MPKLADRISYVMQREHIDSVCDKALLLDYKAELAYMRKDYDVAVKKREKAIHLLENESNAMSICSQIFTTICPMYILHLKKLIKRPKPYLSDLYSKTFQ